MDTIESKISQRKEFLLDDNLEKLQEEYFKKKEKCNTKFNKVEPSKQNNNNQDKNNNLIFITGEMKKKKGKKKIKDVISLNLPTLNPIQPENINNKPNQHSLFSLNYEEHKNIDINNNINIKTGLPETFKIEEKNNIQEENINNNYKNKDDNNNNNNNNISSENVIKENFQCKEYDEINNENEEKIKNMTQEEIIAAQKEIFASIPSDLIEKFKDNFFSQQIKKSLNKKENNVLNIETDNKKEISFENKNENRNDEEKTTNIKISNNLNKKSLNNKENIKENEEIILFSYEGQIKKENKNEYKLYNPEQKEMIDYRYLTFDQLELKNKYFSLEEINSLLSSSNSLQISIGVKIIYNLLKKNYHKTLDIFIEQLGSLMNKLYYLINSTNINVKSESLKCLSLIYHDFFYEDYKIYKFNTLLLGSYPSVIVFNYSNLNKNLQEQKKLCIKNIIENAHDNIIEFIRILNNSMNEEINVNLLSLIFYTIYVSEKIPCQIDKIFEIDFNIISKNQALIKLILVLCEYEDLDKNIENFDKLIKNKYFLKYILELRGIQKQKYNIIITKNTGKTLKNKIYEINYLLLFNNNNSITYDIYSKENDYLLLSKILLLKLYFCLNTENNPDGENYLSLFSSDIEVNFWVDKFRECITKLENNEKDKKLNYIELISIYKYISIFLLLWYKSFRYPKLISFKKINIDLQDILNLFPLFNSILNSTLNNNIFNKNILILDKNDIIRNIYPYNVLLEMNINYIKCFIKNYDKKTNINGLSLYIIKLSELINKGDEYYYNKYIKILKTLICKKLENSKIENINKYFDYKEIEDDLNFYLYSNDDLRKSIYYKRIFSLINNNERLKNINLIIENNNNKDKLFDSKYFPFDNNFIYQIISNDKAKVSIKINYLLILTLLYENENIENIIKSFSSIITPFEIVIKILTTIKLSEFNTNKKLYDLFQKFIKFNIIEGNLENINVSKTDNNKIILGNFFELYESNFFVDENKILIEVIPILFIFLHNNKNEGKNNSKLIEPFRYKKTIESIVYDNFNCIIDFNNYYDLDNNLKEKIINYCINNSSIMFSSFYQTLILSFLKFENNKKNENNNIIYDYAKRLCNEFNIKNEEYQKYVDNDGLLIDIIEKAFIAKNKDKNK